ncbi:MAG: class I SAM-dependent methyltransferase [Deltaproteobacteria bacterium]|nr:class I SAM-dependent methyltransferase [Deltaproteobacteria bacterium]
MDYAATYTEDYFGGKTSFFYRLGYGRFARFHFDSLVRPLRPYLAPYLERPSPSRVLDVGCAYGLVLARMPDRFEKFGVDVSTHAIGEARRRFPASTFVVAGAEEPLPFEPASFDVVLCNDVIEHLEKPWLALANIWDSLAPGGLLYLNTPNLNALRRRFFARADAAEHHISLFEHARLRDLLQNLGFDIVDHWTYTDITYFFFPRFRSNLGIESAFVCRKPLLLSGAREAA